MCFAPHPQPENNTGVGAIELIILLSVVGFVLMAAEVFVPGLVLGILGVLCLIGAVAAAYLHYGVVTGTLILALLSALGIGGFVIWMFAFPHTAIGRKIMLQQSLSRGEGPTARKTGLVGLTGRALTPLRPAGTALVGERKVDVVSEGELIEAGEAVLVVREEGMRVVVRKSASAGEDVA